MFDTWNYFGITNETERQLSGERRERLFVNFLLQDLDSWLC